MDKITLQTQRLSFGFDNLPQDIIEKFAQNLSNNELKNIAKINNKKLIPIFQSILYQREKIYSYIVKNCFSFTLNLTILGKQENVNLELGCMRPKNDEDLAEFISKNNVGANAQLLSVIEFKYIFRFFTNPKYQQEYAAILKNIKFEKIDAKSFNDKTTINSFINFLIINQIKTKYISNIHILINAMSDEQFSIFYQCTLSSLETVDYLSGVNIKNILRRLKYSSIYCKKIIINKSNTLSLTAKISRELQTTDNTLRLTELTTNQRFNYYNW